MKSDLNSIHKHWMNIIYQWHINPHPVTGKSTPDRPYKRTLYFLWSSVGLTLVIPIYILALMGIFVDIVAKRIKKFVESKGISVSILLLVFLWGFLVILTYFLLGYKTATGVFLSSAVAVLSAVVAYLSYLSNNQRVFLMIGYPAIYTALFLPPITLAVLSPVVGDQILEYSTDITIFMQLKFAKPLGLQELFTENFDLQDQNHIILWFFISIIFGWLTGIIHKASNLLNS